MRLCLACHQPIWQQAWWNSALPGPCCSSACVEVALNGPSSSSQSPREYTSLTNRSNPKASVLTTTEGDTSPVTDEWIHVPSDNPLRRLLHTLDARHCE